MTEKRKPALGETWTVQSCMRHGPPLLNVGVNWVKSPVILGETFTTDARIQIYAERLECGCMDFGDVPPRLHRADEKTLHHVPNTPIVSCPSSISISPNTDSFQCELVAGHDGDLHQARVLGHNSEKVNDYEDSYEDLAPDAVVYVRWQEFNEHRDDDVEWHPE